jgi:hypothetical protein
VSDEPIAFALRAGAKVRVRARGQSMRPFIPDGSVVTVAPLAGPVHVGDVVLTIADGGLILHRVLETPMRGGQRFVRTRGDARSGSDPLLPQSAILGRAIELTLGGRAIRLTTWRARLVGWAAARLLFGLSFLRA